MNRSGLYLIIGALIVAVVGFGVYTYRQENKPGVEMKVDSDGVSIQKN